MSSTFEVGQSVKVTAPDWDGATGTITRLGAADWYVFAFGPDDYYVVDLGIGAMEYVFSASQLTSVDPAPTFTVGQSVRILSPHHCAGMYARIERLYMDRALVEFRNGSADCALSEIKDAEQWLAERHPSAYPGMSTDAHPLGVADYPISADSLRSALANEKAWHAATEDALDNALDERNSLRTERDEARADYTRAVDALRHASADAVELRAQLETERAAYVAATRCHLAANAERDRIADLAADLADQLAATTDELNHDRQISRRALDDVRRAANAQLAAMTDQYDDVYKRVLTTLRKGQS